MGYNFRASPCSFPLTLDTYFGGSLPANETCSEENEQIFPPDFICDAASRVPAQGYTVFDVCGQFDLGENILRRWVNQLKLERIGRREVDLGSDDYADALQACLGSRNSLGGFR